MSNYFQEFKKRECKVLGVCPDNLKNIVKWIPDIMCYHNLDDFSINMISDERQDIVRMLGANDSSYLDFFTGMPVPSRGLFIIDATKVVAMKSFYPWSVGINTNHLLETIDSLQNMSKPKENY